MLDRIGRGQKKNTKKKLMDLQIFSLLLCGFELTVNHCVDQCLLTISSLASPVLLGIPYIPGKTSLGLLLNQSCVIDSHSDSRSHTTGQLPYLYIIAHIASKLCTTITSYSWSFNGCREFEQTYIPSKYLILYG